MSTSAIDLKWILTVTMKMRNDDEFWNGFLPRTLMKHTSDIIKSDLRIPENGFSITLVFHNGKGMRRPALFGVMDHVRCYPGIN